MATVKNDLTKLLDMERFDTEPWVKGNIPWHYKRLTCSRKKAIELARLGSKLSISYFDLPLYFTQSMIFGAAFSGDYDHIVISTCSQYGKSFVMGHIALLKAFFGEPQYIAGGTADLTAIIMWNTLRAVSDAAPELQNELLEKADKLEKLTTSASKQKIAFKDGGFVEPASLGDMYGDIDHNKAVGRGGNYIVDEAAEVSEKTFVEMERAQFARTDGKSYQIIMISNPHRPGKFYDSLSGEAGERTLVIWMDALTAVEERRWSRKRVETSEFAKNKRTRRVYLLCELEETGDSMFDDPVLYEGSVDGDYIQHFMGIDAAYKGKDSISICLNAVTEDGIAHIQEITTINVHDWENGKTSVEIAKKIARLARSYHVALICVDIGYGIWLVEELSKMGLPVKGINFQSSPSKARVKAKHFAAVYAANKRAEMHLDLQDLMENKAVMFERDAWEQIKSTMPFISEVRQRNGKILIRPKTEIKARMNGKSPDELDSVLLAIQAGITFGGESLTYE